MQWDKEEIIQKAKKEVFDDIDAAIGHNCGWIDSNVDNLCNSIPEQKYLKIKERHLTHFNIRKIQSVRIKKPYIRKSKDGGSYKRRIGRND